jgi:hypothetical protein
MLATQTLNTQERPIYGVYIIGSLWWFVVLQGNQYAVSDPFNAFKEEELFKIFSILKRCKSYIEAFTLMM